MKRLIEALGLAILLEHKYRAYNGYMLQTRGYTDSKKGFLLSLQSTRWGKQALGENHA